MNPRGAILLALAACQAPSSSSSPGPVPAATTSTAMVCPADQLGTLTTKWARRDCAGSDAACRAACETDHEPGACMSEAILLESKPETAKDAIAYYIHACEAGLASGCTNYAAFLWKNNRDNSAAVCALAMFDQSCAVGDPFACGMAGRMIVETASTPDEIVRGQARLETACRGGGFPCRVLALEMESGKLAGGGDHDRIEQLLLSACKGGDAPACGIHATVAETFK